MGRFMSTTLLILLAVAAGIALFGRRIPALRPYLEKEALAALLLGVSSGFPFAMIGGVFGLLLAGEYLSVPASVGFIALLGIAVLNGVVMVTYFNQLLARGMAVSQVAVGFDDIKVLTPLLEQVRVQRLDDLAPAQSNPLSMTHSGDAQ